MATVPPAMLSEKPWKPDLVVRLLAAIFLSVMLGSLIVHGYKALTGGAEGQPTPDREMVFFLLGIFFFQGVGLALVDVFVRLHRISWTEAFGFNQPRKARTIFLAIIITIFILPVALSLTALSAKILQQFQVPVEPQEAVRVLQITVNRSDLIIHGIAAILIAPLFEELIFRGILYPAARQNGSRALALWGTSILFALIHLSPMIVVPLIVLSIILTFLYETTNNLLAPIVAHSLFNAANFAYFVWQRYQQGSL